MHRKHLHDLEKADSMNSYEVKITNKALEDMESIHDYIANVLLSKINADNQYDRIANTILSLDMNPKRIKTIEFELENLHELRQMVVDNYSIFFIVKNNTVYVISILYSASDIIRK